MIETFEAVFYDDSNTWGTPQFSGMTKEQVVEFIKQEHKEVVLRIHDGDEVWVVSDPEGDLGIRSQYFCIVPGYVSQSMDDVKSIRQMGKSREINPKLFARLLAGETFSDQEFFCALHGIAFTQEQPVTTMDEDRNELYNGVKTGCYYDENGVRMARIEVLKE